MINSLNKHWSERVPQDTFTVEQHFEISKSSLCFLTFSSGTRHSILRVCRACHRVSGVKVPVPGVSGAEGKEKGKGVIVR